MELQFFRTDRIEEKLDKLVKVAWELLQRKIAGGLVKVNKEASLQLHYAYILQELITICQFSDAENVKVVLEKTIAMGDNSTQEIDVVIETMVGGVPYHVAIEMKCYRKIASSGHSRGGINVFVKEVYEDIASLEKYKVRDTNIKRTYFLVMVDYENIVVSTNPSNGKKKTPKYKAYDISDGFELNGPIDISVDAGDNKDSIHIEGRYKFDWSVMSSSMGNLYFMILDI